MKKKITALAGSLILFFTFNAHAQKKGDTWLGFGVGTAHNYNTKYRVGIGAGVRATLDVGVFEGDNFLISAGGMLAFSSTSINNYAGPNDNYHNYIWQNFVVAGRGTFSYYFDEKLEVYAGVGVGARILHTREERVHKGTTTLYNYTRTNPFVGLFAGAAYKFTPKFAVFGEVGYDVMWFTAGVKFKL